MVHSCFESNATLYATLCPFSPRIRTAAFAVRSLHNGGNGLLFHVEEFWIRAEAIRRVQDSFVETLRPLERIQENVKRPTNDGEHFFIQNRRQILFQRKRHVFKEIHRARDEIKIQRFETVEHEIINRHQRVLGDGRNRERHQPHHVSDRRSRRHAHHRAYVDDRSHSRPLHRTDRHLEPPLRRARRRPRNALAHARRGVERTANGVSRRVFPPRHLIVRPIDRTVPSSVRGRVISRDDGRIHPSREHHPLRAQVRSRRSQRRRRAIIPPHRQQQHRVHLRHAPQRRRARHGRSTTAPSSRTRSTASTARDGERAIPRARVFELIIHRDERARRRVPSRGEHGHRRVRGHRPRSILASSTDRARRKLSRRIARNGCYERSDSIRGRGATGRCDGETAWAEARRCRSSMCVQGFGAMGYASSSSSSSSSSSHAGGWSAVTTKRAVLTHATATTAAPTAMMGLGTV